VNVFYDAHNDLMMTMLMMHTRRTLMMMIDA